MQDNRWATPLPQNDHPDQTPPKARQSARPRTPAVRWVRSRKAAVVQAIRDGFLTFTEAQDKYQISIEELKNWQQQFDTEGKSGLSMRALVHKRRSTAD